MNIGLKKAPMTSIRIEAAFIFLVSLFLFTVGLSSQEVIGFESRFYLFALEMWRHGAAAFPTTYSTLYPDYPATSTWLIYLLATAWGGLNKGVAVFPSAFAASLTMVVTYLIGTLQNKRVGLAAVCFLLLTVTFVKEARTISLDQFVTLVTALCFYVVYSAQCLHRRTRLMCIPVLWLLGFVFRGPIGLVIPAGVVCVFYLLDKDWKRCLIAGAVAFILLILASAALLGVAYQSGGNAFMHAVLRMEMIGRLETNQTPPFYFYFIECIGAYAVTYPLMIGSCIYFKKDFFKQDAVLKLFGWVLIILIGLSIPADKKIRYILPIAPALALLCAHAAMKFRRFQCRYLVVAALVFVLGEMFVIEPINLTSNKTHAFVQQVERIRATLHAPLFFYQEGSDGLPIKYLVNMPKEDKLFFVEHADDILHASQPGIFISNEQNFQQLPKSLNAKVQVLMRGKIGHKPVVVFVVKSS